MSDSTYSDFSLSFKKHPSTKDVISKYDVDSVKQALTTLFLTNNYEKLFDPQFGIGVRGMLFDLATPLAKLALKKKIENQISFYEPRVVVQDIVIRDNLDSNELIIELFYYVIDNPNNTELLTLSFERVR